MKFGMVRKKLQRLGESVGEYVVDVVSYTHAFTLRNRKNPTLEGIPLGARNGQSTG